MMAQILDACCGGRMMWHRKDDPRVLAMDARRERIPLCDGRVLEVNPDVMGDFRRMPFFSGQFRLVLFDPPHLVRAGCKSWLKAKYGKLDKATFKDDLRRGFAECWRVLSHGGTLVFKWNTEQIPLREISAAFPAEPVFKTGKGKTYIIIFFKP